jgi:hypothetical protein
VSNNENEQTTKQPRRKGAPRKGSIVYEHHPVYGTIRHHITPSGQSRNKKRGRK